MPRYVLLNFEDADPNAGPGPVTGIKGKHVPTYAGAGAAAAGTAKVYQNRAIAKSSEHGRKRVVFYPCQEILQRNQAGQLAKTDLENIRKDCMSAKTIAFIIHGEPEETEHGFGTDGSQLCTWRELGNLARLLLPQGHSYNIALIMCYGARSQNARLDHRGQIPDTDLKTSFAYKFFRRICVKRQVRMTARTGAVSNDMDVNHMVETEEQVFLALDTAAAKVTRNTNKDSMEAEKKELQKKLKLDDEKFQQQFGPYLLKYVDFPHTVPKRKDKLDEFASRYVLFTPYFQRHLANKYDPDALGNRAKYGKLVYTYTGGRLKILARYSKTGNDVLYDGKLL